MAPVQGLVDGVPCFPQSNGFVGALNVLSRKLCLEPLARELILGDDEEAARPFIEPVHDARADLAHGIVFIEARAIEGATGQEAVHEGAPRMPSRRMNHDAGRFVDDEEVLVFEDDVEGDRIIGGRGRRFWREGTDLDEGSRAGEIRRSPWLVVHRHTPRCDPPLNGRSRGFRPGTSQIEDDEAIETLS